jgi:hypothetical protein
VEAELDPAELDPFVVHPVTATAISTVLALRLWAKTTCRHAAALPQSHKWSCFWSAPCGQVLAPPVPCSCCSSLSPRRYMHRCRCGVHGRGVGLGGGAVCGATRKPAVLSLPGCGLSPLGCRVVEAPLPPVACPCEVNGLYGTRRVV